MKRIISFFIVLSCLFVTLSLPVYANQPQNDECWDRFWDAAHPHVVIFRDQNVGSGVFSIDDYNFNTPCYIYHIDTPHTSGTLTTGQTAYYNIYDLSNTEKASINSDFDSAYPSATRLAGATAFYNNHSYAWHSQNSTTNHYWILYPDCYINDYSYDLVSTPQVGYIVCYLNSSGTIVHSGIIYSIQTGTSNGLCGIADLLTVESKWEIAGLYRHNGYECPYTSYSNNGDAVSLAFYRAHVHSYTHSYTDNGDDATHTSHCICGATIVENHNWRQVHLPSAVDPEEGNRYVVGWKCSKCNAITYYNPNLK